jgi:O-antigen biosynthesis protein WbqP
VKRLFDISLAIGLLAIFAIPMLLLVVAIKLTSDGPALYWSDRVGVNNSIFKMPKFRTMKVNTPIVATHLLASPERYLTPIGKVLRKYSLDELPQLVSVALGKMSFVGPRPALYNQSDLIQLRTEKSIHTLTPGITGWAQINGRDDLPIPVKVDLDEYYLYNRSFLLDLKTLWLTFFSVLASKGITH